MTLTLKFNRVRAVAKVHVPAKLHQAECSGSWVVVLRGKKTPTKTIQCVATARTVTKWMGKAADVGVGGVESVIISPVKLCCSCWCRCTRLYFQSTLFQRWRRVLY